MEKHVTLVAALHIALGALGVLAGAIVFMAVAGGGLLSGDLDAIFITSGVATVISAIIFILSVPSIIGGLGLLKRAAWGRLLIIIISILDLLNIPIGTVLGAYSLWVLLSDETTKSFVAKTA